LKGDIRKLLALACYLTESKKVDFSLTENIKNKVKSKHFYAKLSKLYTEKFDQNKMRYFMFEMSQMVDVKKIKELGSTVEALYNYLLNLYMMWRFTKSKKRDIPYEDFLHGLESKAIFDKIRLLILKYNKIVTNAI
jgi:hypothetical protein